MEKSDYDQKKDDAYRRVIEKKYANNIIKKTLQDRVKLAIVKTKSGQTLVVKFCGREFDSELEFYNRFRNTNISLNLLYCHSVTGTLFTEYQPDFLNLKQIHNAYEFTDEEKEENFEIFKTFLIPYFDLCVTENGEYIDYRDIHTNPSNIGFNIKLKKFIFFEGGTANNKRYSTKEGIMHFFFESLADGRDQDMQIYRAVFPTKEMKKLYKKGFPQDAKKLKLDTQQEANQEYDCNKTLPEIEAKLKNLFL